MTGGPLNKRERNMITKSDRNGIGKFSNKKKMFFVDPRSDIDEVFALASEAYHTTSNLLRKKSE